MIASPKNMAKPGFLRHVFTMGGLTAVSRVLGLVREMMQSRLIGAGVEQSAFTLAFAIPNMARKLFGEGALTAAFVPVFKGELETVGIEKAARLARAVVTMMILMVGAMVSIALAVTFFASFNPPQGADPYRWALTCKLVGILLPYMLAICAAAFGMGVLNALGHFKAAGFMPAFLNILWICALAVLCLFPGLSVSNRIVFVAGAILVGGFSQMVFMFVCMARAGVSPMPLFSGWSGEKVRLVWRNTAIAALGAGAIQVNYALDQLLGQLAAPWAASVIGYAERLMDLPLGVIGVAFGTVLLPTFAGFFAKNDFEGARGALLSSIKNLLFLMLPAAAGLFVLAPDVTSAIYEGGAFDSEATLRVSRALAVYAIGLGFFGIQKSFVPWFQSQNDMKTPLRVTVWTVLLNASLNIAAVIFLPQEWRHVGLAASTTFCAAVGSAALLAAAYRRNGSLGLTAIVGDIAKILFAAVMMAFAVNYLKPLISKVIDNGYISLAIIMTVGAVVYASLALLLGVGFRRRQRAAAKR